MTCVRVERRAHEGGAPELDVGAMARAKCLLLGGAHVGGTGLGTGGHPPLPGPPQRSWPVCCVCSMHAVPCTRRMAGWPCRVCTSVVRLPVLRIRSSAGSRAAPSWCPCGKARTLEGEAPELDVRAGCCWAHSRVLCLIWVPGAPRWDARGWMAVQAWMAEASAGARQPPLQSVHLHSQEGFGMLRIRLAGCACRDEGAHRGPGRHIAVVCFKSNLRTPTLRRRHAGVRRRAHAARVGHPSQGRH